MACGRPRAAAEPEQPESTFPGGRVANVVKTNDDHQVTVWEKRPTSGEVKGVVVLLHDRTWSSVPSFDLQVPGEEKSLMDQFVAAGWACYAIDMRGYGASARDASGFIEPERTVNDLGNVLNWVGIRDDEEAALVGWSYGALVALLAAQYFPDHATSLVLMGLPAVLPFPEAAAPAEAPMQANTREAAASDFVTEGAISDAARAAFVEQALAADPIGADWRKLHEFNVIDPSKVRTPTLLLYGEHDPLAPPEAREKLLAQLSSKTKQLQTVPGTDHAAHLEKTGDVAKRMIDFITKYAK